MTQVLEFTNIDKLSLERDLKVSLVLLSLLLEVFQLPQFNGVRPMIVAEGISVDMLQKIEDHVSDVTHRRNKA